MADYNRNKRGSYRTSNQDWNENRGGRGRQEDDRNYGSSANRGYGNSGNFNQGDTGWQSRYEREDYNRGDAYGSGGYGQYSGDTNSGNYGNESNYGSSNYGSYGSGSNFGSGNYNRGSRNLYDRDYEGMNRSSYSESGTRMGGANYGGYGDSGRFNEGRNEYRGFGSRESGYNYDRDRNQGGREDRNWWDRATDEVSSWFGDDDAERRRERDRQMSGQHKGKGPKNYTRSDDRIKDDVNDRLSDDPFIDASEIDVTVSNGEVTLTGTVDHRSTKRRAEDLAESVSGVKNVENRIRVGTQASTYGSTGSQITGSQGSTSQSTLSGTTSESTSAVPGSERERTRSKSYV